MLVGNKVDSAKRRVSLQEGEAMARELGCGFVEVSAKNGGNVEEAFYTIVKQLQKQSATTGIKALDDLVDSLPEWDDLLKHLEGEISRSTIASTRSLVLALPSKETRSSSLTKTSISTRPSLRETPTVISGSQQHPTLWTSVAGLTKSKAKFRWLWHVTAIRESRPLCA